MANCLYTDVTKIIDTGLSSGDISALITLADEEITERGLSGDHWTTNNLKRLSMYLTAEMVSLNDTRSRAIGETSELPNYAKRYRDLAEGLINRVGEVPFVVYAEPVEDEEV